MIGTPGQNKRRARQIGRTMRRAGIAVENTGLLLCSVGLIVSAFYAVIVRYLPISGRQMAWTEEAALLFVVWLAYWGVASVERVHEHFVLDFLVKGLRPRIRLGITVLLQVLSLAFLVFVIKDAFALIREEWGSVSTVLHYPVWLLPLSLFVSSWLMLIYIGLALARNFQRFWRR